MKEKLARTVWLRFKAEEVLFRFILILLAGCMVGGLLNLEDAQADDFLPNNWFNQPPLTPRQIKFFKQYPNAQSCLPSSEQAKTNPNLKKFDWSSINNDDHAIVCIFRIAEDLGTPEALGEWLKTFEFNVHGPQQDGQR